MAKRNTRQEIVDAFIKRVEASSLASVRVADIIEPLGINRNTFYYHFPSKQDVAMEILKQDLDSELRHRLPERSLVLEPETRPDAQKKRYAIFTHIETGARTLDGTVFMESFLSCVDTRLNFYRKLFNRSEYEFGLSLKNLYMPLFVQDVAFTLGGRYLPDILQKMISRHCVDLLFSTVRLYCDEPDPLLLDRESNPFLNVIYENLFREIQDHPVSRRPR